METVTNQTIEAITELQHQHALEQRQAENRAKYGCSVLAFCLDKSFSYLKGLVIKEA